MAVGGAGALWMTNVCNAVVKDGEILGDWKSWMVNVLMHLWFIQGQNLVEHAMKVMEKVNGGG